MGYPTYFSQNTQGGNFLSPSAAMPQQMQSYAAMPQRMAPMRSMYEPPMTVIRVSGRAGADAFIMPPNSEAILLNENENIFYYKTTDGAGYPTVQECEFNLRTPAATATVAYATQDELTALREEFAELKGALNNGKQSRKARTEGDE